MRGFASIATCTWIALSLGPLGCGGSQQTTAQVASPSSAPSSAPLSALPSRPPNSPAPHLKDGKWARFRSARHRLSIPFPDGKTWRIRDRGSQWLVASHRPTRATVIARRWIMPAPIGIDACVATARQGVLEAATVTGIAEIPAETALSVVDRDESTSRFADGVSSRMVVGIRTGVAPSTSSADAQGRTGYALGFGITGRTCIALVVQIPFDTASRPGEALRKPSAFHSASNSGSNSTFDIAEQLGIAARIVDNTYFLPAFTTFRTSE